jgi:hypothetical protein
MESIFSKGCLVVLSISTYSGTVRVDKKTVKDRMQTKQCKASKFLLPENSLKDVNSAAAGARAWLRSISLPFPIKGAVFVPFDLVERIDSNLSLMKSSFDEATSKFVDNYYNMIQEVRPDLVAAGLYNEKDYPSNIDSRFAFSWKFITISAPGDNKYLSPEFIRREQEKFTDTLREAQEMAINALRSEFVDLVDNAVDRLTVKDGEKKKIFKAATVENFQEFFSTFTARNCFGDEELKKLVEKATTIMKGVSAETLRANDDFRSNIAERLARVKAEMNEGMVNAGRKLNLDD